VKTLIFFIALTCQHQQIFRKHPITYGCADPFQNVLSALSAGFIRLLWRHVLLTVVTVVWPRPSVAPPISCFNTSTVRVHATAQLLFQSTISPLKCCEKLWRTPSYRLSGKNHQGFAQVRGLQASTCLCQRFTLLIERSIGAEPKLFLWNSLIKSLPVGDAFKGTVAWDFSVFQKV
jgi:hypothetical protein